MQQHLGTTFSLFQATEYTQQVVAGTVYHVKIQIQQSGDNNDQTAAAAVHVRIFEPLPYTQEPPQLQAAVVAKHNDALVPLDVQL